MVKANFLKYFSNSVTIQNEMRWKRECFIVLQNLRKTPHGVIATLQTIKMLQAEEGSVTCVRGSCVSGNVRTQGSSNLKTTDAKAQQHAATADRDLRLNSGLSWSLLLQYQASVDGRGERYFGKLDGCFLLINRFLHDIVTNTIHWQLQWEYDKLVSASFWGNLTCSINWDLHYFNKMSMSWMLSWIYI